MKANVRYCVCGHDDFAHEHYRLGSGCSLCPIAACCTHFRDRAGIVNRIRRVLFRPRPERCRNCRQRITDLAGAVREHPAVWCSMKCRDAYVEFWEIR